MTEPASYVVVHHPAVGEVVLEPGDLVGRLATAALCLEQPQISEVHAYVSLRDGSLKLLSLRGGLAVSGRLVREVTLAAGQTIHLAVGHALTVLEVCNPTSLLALRSEDGTTQVLVGSAVSLVAGRGRCAGIEIDAAVVLWPNARGWLAQAAGDSPAPVAVGDVLQAGPDRYEVVELPIASGDTPATIPGARLDSPLRLEGYFDTLHVHRDGASTVVLSGAAGRLLCELGAIAQPVHWVEVARTVWGEEKDTERLRKRWDVLLIRLRRRLAAESLRTDLVHPDGAGNIRLLLTPHDSFVDLS